MHGDSELDLAPHAEGVEFEVKVVPGASRSRLAGLWGRALKVAVSAPPEGGKANAALVRLLSEVLGVRPADVRVVRGHGSPRKRVRVSGLAIEEVRRRLS